MEALIGLVITSSNSGSTSPVALMVFSMLPLSTTAAVIMDFFREVVKPALSRTMTRIRMRTKPPMRRIVFPFRLATTCSERALSMSENLHREVQGECQRQRGGDQLFNTIFFIINVRNRTFCSL